MRTMLVMFLVGCGSGFSGNDGHAGDGGAAAVAASASGSGGADAEASTAQVSAVSASSSSTSSSSSTAGSSSSSGGGALTSEQMYKLFCVDKMPMAGTDHCDATHGNCHCVAGGDPACPFQCGSYKYCCTLWVNPYTQCTLGGGPAWKGVGSKPHEGSNLADGTYCAN